jgi:hypothetical protein
MAMQKIRYRSKKTGELAIYEYEPRYYHVTAVERCREALRKRPLKLVKKGSGGARWSAGQRGPVFNDATVVKLIEEGFAVCLGEFVEIKGKVR